MNIDDFFHFQKKFFDSFFFYFFIFFICELATNGYLINEIKQKKSQNIVQCPYNDVDIGSLRTLFDKYLGHMLVRFELNCMKRNIQNFEAFGKCMRVH